MNDADDVARLLGRCCHCQAASATVTVMLERRAPVPGTGWGCVVCGLPCDGAIAVLCAGCAGLVMVKGAYPELVCEGFAGENNRRLASSLRPEPFEHDEAKHLAEEIDDPPCL